MFWITYFGKSKPLELKACCNKLDLNQLPPVPGEVDQAKEKLSTKGIVSCHKFLARLKFMEIAVAGYCDIVLTEDQIL